MNMWIFELVFELIYNQLYVFNSFTWELLIHTLGKFHFIDIVCLPGLKLYWLNFLIIWSAVRKYEDENTKVRRRKRENTKTIIRRLKYKSTMTNTPQYENEESIISRFVTRSWKLETVQFTFVLLYFLDFSEDIFLQDMDLPDTGYRSLL